MNRNLPEILAQIADDVELLDMPVEMPDGTDERHAARAASATTMGLMLAATGRLTFLTTAAMGIARAAAEEDPKALRFELVKTAAVLTSWIDAIDQREK